MELIASIGAIRSHSTARSLHLLLEHTSAMPERCNHVVLGPLGRCIVNLTASPNGRVIAFQHVLQNYDTFDDHWLSRADGEGSRSDLRISRRRQGIPHRLRGSE